MNNRNKNRPKIFRFLSDEQNCQYILSNVTGMNNESETDFFDSITRFGMGTGIIGFVVFAMSYIFVTCLNHAAENQVRNMSLSTLSWFSHSRYEIML